MRRQMISRAASHIQSCLELTCALISGSQREVNRFKMRAHARHHHLKLNSHQCLIMILYFEAASDELIAEIFGINL